MSLASPFDFILSKVSRLFTLKSRVTVVGLSIGSSSVKLVELKKVGKSWRLIHFGVVELPEGAVVQREINNSLMVTDAIKSLLSEIQLKTKAVCTALSGTALLVRRMVLEVPKIEDLKDQVFWEAEQYLPFDGADVVMDFEVISRTAQGKTDVIFVAAKQSVMEGYLSCISEAGLKPEVVDVDLFALQNVFEVNYPDYIKNSVLLVDIGAVALKIIILEQGAPSFTRDVALGGKNLTLEIQKYLNLSLADAESLKLGADQNGKVPKEVNELIRTMIDNSCMEIRKAIDYYNASVSGTPISLILLTGGSAQLKDFSKIVEETVGIPTQIMNSFNLINYDPNIFNLNYINKIGPIAAIPLGLALRLGAE